MRSANLFALASLQLLIDEPPQGMDVVLEVQVIQNCLSMRAALGTAGAIRNNGQPDFSGLDGSPRKELCRANSVASPESQQPVRRTSNKHDVEARPTIKRLLRFNAVENRHECLLIGRWPLIR